MGDDVLCWKRRGVLLAALLLTSLVASIVFSTRVSSPTVDGRRRLGPLTKYVDPKSVKQARRRPTKGTRPSKRQYEEKAEKSYSWTSILSPSVFETFHISPPSEPIDQLLPDDPIIQQRRRNCQIIYVLGVEGSIHHGFMPVIETLARQQVDPVTDYQYHVTKGHPQLRDAIFSSENIDDPNLVQATIEGLCPYYTTFWTESSSWQKYVVIEGNSFPSGGANVSPFFTPRQRYWSELSPEGIAADELALRHPTSLQRFYDAYSPYVDVKFVVLHRPYLDTIASHVKYELGPKMHSTVVGGFLLILSRFLAGHMYGTNANGVSEALWTIVCADKLQSKTYGSADDLAVARQEVLAYLVRFLGWSTSDCASCWDEWVETTKKKSVEQRLGKEGNLDLIAEDRDRLAGVWPPRREEDSLPVQQCQP